LAKRNLQRNGIAHIAVEKFNPVLNAVQEAHGVGLAPHQAINLVPKIEQIFGEIAAVLTGNSRDESCFHESSFSCISFSCTLPDA
jgi:hypothetical protein